MFIMPLILLLYALFASIFVLGKFVLQSSAPLFTVGFRMSLAGFFFIAFLYFFQRDKLKFNKSQIKDLIALSIFNIFLTNSFEFWGLQYLDAAKACFIYSFSPIFSTILSYFFFKERVTFKKWMGLLVGFIGFFPILLHNSPYEKNLSHLLFLSEAELALIGACICSVLGWIFLKKLMTSNVSPLAANGISMLIGGIFSLFASMFFETWDPVPVTNWTQMLIFTATIALISNLICYNLYGKLLKIYTASFLAFCGLLTPVFTALFGWLFLQETLSWHFYVSTVVVFIGLSIFYLEELRLGYLVKPKLKKA